MDRTFHIYILASESAVLYVGMTNDIVRRIREHRERKVPGFTKKYNVTKVVWFEAHGRATSAIAREKQIKGWSRAKKIANIEAMNPLWQDFSNSLKADLPLET
jgi:putative endonuclease